MAGLLMRKGSNGLWLVAERGLEAQCFNLPLLPIRTTNDECGTINKDLKLSDRVWKCKRCKAVNERDRLAARNIKKFAIKDYSGQELSVEPVEMSALVESVNQEAQPIGSAVGG